MSLELVDLNSLLSGLANRKVETGSTGDGD